MLAATSTPASPSLKRPHVEDDVDDRATPPLQDDVTPASSVLSSPVAASTPRDSPMPSSAPKASQALSIPPESTATSPQKQTSAPDAQPSKRRKLTPQEKAQRDAEKEAKARERTEAKAKKEEEQRKKAEEKEAKLRAKELEKQQKEEELRAKEEEKRKKAEEKEEEKRKKETEKEEKKKAKELEKQKKERSQLRLSAFFNLPTGSPPAPLNPSITAKASPSPAKPQYITKEDARRKSLSLEPGESVESLLAPIKSENLSSDTVEQVKKLKTGFLPFSVPKHTTLAPYNCFLPPPEELARVNEELDSSTTSSTSAPSFPQKLARYKTTRGYQPLQVRRIIEQLQGSPKSPIDLTLDGQDRSLKQLGGITMKYFHFGEDVRPPYCGTWTRPQTLEQAHKLARNPHRRLLPEVNYDYDSEAEWEEPEEGEDLDCDDDEEDLDDCEEDMDGFVDDENAPEFIKPRKGHMTNDLEPVCSGLQWEDASGALKPADGSSRNVDFSDFRMGFLLEPCPRTIDPFTTAYWDPEPSTVGIASLLKDKAGLMNPPRMPLQDRPNGFVNGANIQTTINGKTPKAAKVRGRVVPAEQIEAFKQAISGSDLTKIALIESLKKQFPKLKKDEITETLPLVAARIGAKQADKRWVLLNDAQV